MANNSVVTQEKLQEFYNTKVYPYLNGSVHSGYTPIGTVISLMGNTAPSGYLICDGTEYNISDYSDLANYFTEQFGSNNYFGGDGTTTFAVPDLQGEFLRGSGTNSHSGEGSGSTVGTHQAGTIHIGWDTAGSYSYTPLSRINNIPVNCDVKTNGAASSYYYKNSGTNTEIHTSYYTARPTNTSVLFCIAYQNIYIDSAVGNYPVEVTSPTDGQLLMYDATAGRWVNGGHIYSTEEHIVGKWIDSKPIYEITISCTSPSSVGLESNIYNLSSLSADYIVNQEITLISGAEMIPANWHYGSSSFGVTNVFARCTRAYIKMSVGVSSYCSMPVIAILRYTKTTD